MGNTADWIDAGKEELDRINVFPVPDGDTGTNSCSTFRAVAEAVRKLGPSPLPTVTKTMAQRTLPRAFEPLSSRSTHHAPVLLTT